MEDNLEKLFSKNYFPETAKTFLGNKKFQIVIRNQNPDYNFSINTHSLYDFVPKNDDNSTQSKRLSHFTLRQRMNIGDVTLQNRYRPYKDAHVLNSAALNMGKSGIVEIIHRASRERTIQDLTLRHIYLRDSLISKSDLRYSTEHQIFDLSAYAVYSFTANPARKTFFSNLTHTGGISMDLTLNTFRLRSLDMYYHLHHAKQQLLLAHISKDPTFDNFLGKFVLGYIRRSPNNVNTIVKMVHDYRTKETNIDLVRESRISEKAIVRNKITSNYNIGTSLTYNINDKIKICHAAEADLRKFFKMEENYKFGIKVEVDL